MTRYVATCDANIALIKSEKKTTSNMLNSITIGANCPGHPSTTSDILGRLMQMRKWRTCGEKDNVVQKYRA